MKRVLVCDKISDAGIDVLESTQGLSVDIRIGIKPEELMEVIGDYDALIIRSATKITADIIAAATKLKVIGRAGVGTENIDMKAVNKKGVLVLNSPTGNVVTTAEHSIAMMMAVSRKIPQAAASIQQGKWEKHLFTGSEMMNKTLGIIGMGRVGKLVAERALGLKMKVIVFDPFISRTAAQAWGVEAVDMETILASSDYLTIHLPLTEETNGFINREKIARMKKGVFIVNCARGGIINEADLAEALHSGHVAGAACDVFETEPIEKDNPLLSAPNFIGSPHIAASTNEAQENVGRVIALHVADYLTSGVVDNAVNFPSIDPVTSGKIAPYLSLAISIGSTHGQLLTGQIVSVNIKYSGVVAELNVKPITNAVVKGLLSIRCKDEINMVNSLVFAQDLGINVVESISNQHRDFTSLISVEVSSETETRLIEGTVLGKNEARFVKIDDYFIEAKPSRFMLIFSNKDEPGVIGDLGTLLGKRKINIAGMQMSRTTPHGKALAIINIDSRLNDADLFDIVHIENAIEAKQVILENV